MSSQGKQQLVELGALWYSTKTPGVMTGKVNGNTRIIYLPNDRKEKETQPDGRIFLAPAEKREEEKGNGRQW
jgi:hypothetical protein